LTSDIDDFDTKNHWYWYQDFKPLF